MRHIYPRALVAALAPALLFACGASTRSAQTTPSPSPLSCTASGPASASWAGTRDRTSTSPPAIVSAVAAGDTLTLTFDQGTPEFTIQQFPSAHFQHDASGLPVDLAGTAGVRIAMTGFRGDTSNYTGPMIFDSSGPLLLQVAEIGDFEGYVSWGAGLSGPACANVTASGSTLTFHFIPALKTGSP